MKSFTEIIASDQTCEDWRRKLEPNDSEAQITRTAV
jgi:hypothetical protein